MTANAGQGPCPDAATLERFLQGTLVDPAAQALEQHLLHCEPCWAIARGCREDDLLVPAMRPGPVAVAVDETVRQLMQELHRQCAVLPDDGPSGWPLAFGPEEGPTGDLLPGTGVGPYRLVACLGSGGMGVVYRATHEQLGRDVALKMLRVGTVGDGQRLARFRQESLVIAQLRHPGIVPIYEVGEHHSRPWFAMELAEGGSLAARLAVSPLSAREAASLGQTLAEAVQAAHERGIIHRDLKPANVLLAADGSPKVSDFGIAKQLDASGCTTDTGAILGTPNYMAPEQGGGGTGEVGPAADVYALGAILYECLTGRPPFRGATVLQTLDQVRHEEPPPPGRLQPGLPRDLETICLKCLEKDPARRYASAADLAADLCCFLEGKPIRARPVGPFGRLGKWARRRPAVAGLVGLCFLCLAALVAGVAVYQRDLHAAVVKAEAESGRADENARLAQEEATRADANYRKARHTLQRMLQVASGSRWNGVPRIQQLRREQLTAALAFYEEVARQKASTPLVKEDVARACLQAAKYQLSLGRREQAVENARRAVSLAEELVHARPEDASYRLLKADALRTLGSEGGPIEGMRHLEHSVSELEGLLQHGPRSPEALEQLAASHSTLGAAYHLKDKDHQAMRCLVRAVELYTDLVERQPRLSGHHTARARARLNLAAAYQRLRQPAQAHAQNTHAERDLEEQLAASPDDRDAIDGLAVLRVNMAYAVAQRQSVATALAYVSRNLPMLQQALMREPYDVLVRDRLHRSHGVRAEMLARAGRYAEAVKDWEQMMAFAAVESPGHRLDFARLLIRTGDHARGAAEIEAGMKKFPPPVTADKWKWAASLYEEAAEAAGKDARLATEERQERQKRYRDSARAALTEAGKVPQRGPQRPDSPGAKRP